MPKVIPDPVYYDDQEYKDGAGEEVLADTNREFSWRGKQYITYLTEANAERIDEFMEGLVEFATLIPASSSSSGSRPTNKSGPGGSTKSAEREENRRIREWCLSQQMKVSDRGRIPNWAKKAYFQAHPDERPVTPIDD